jgi:hypothetical protein
MLGAALLDQIARVVTGEKDWRLPGTVTTIIPPQRTITGPISVIDGDTVRADGATFRLVGFNAPESGRDAGCNKERQLAAKATGRMKQLAGSSHTSLQRVPCAWNRSLQLRPSMRSDDDRWSRRRTDYDRRRARRALHLQRGQLPAAPELVLKSD